jgi:hypothetical protein
MGILYEAFGGSGSVLSVDPHPLGDVRRMVRVPNTLRPPENKSFCTYLPPDEFPSMSWEDLVLHTKSPHTYDYELTRDRPSIQEFKPPSWFDGGFAWSSIGDCPSIVPKGEGTAHEFLKRILRPCLYKHIIRSDPPHVVRVATTVDLLTMGLPPEDVFELYRQLKWADWDPKTTRYQIDSCRKLKPYSCKTLRRFHIPERCCVG